MNTELNYIFEVLDELRNNSGSNKKLEILRANIGNELLQRVFKYAYDKDYKYGITAARIVERPSLVYDAIAEENMFDVLDKLRNRELTGNAALEACTEYYNGSEWGPLFRLIINHDLNDGLGATTLKKVWPNMFSTFGVALAEVWDDKMRNKIDMSNGNWLASRKLDGCRAICIKKGKDVKIYSRSGKEYLTLDVLKSEISQLPGDFVLDGECCIVNEHGDENFTDIIKEIKRKNHTIKNPHYFIFDCLTLDEFESHTSTATLTERLARLSNINIDKVSHAEVLKQTQLTSYEQFDEMIEEAAQKGWEGLIIRKNVGYEGKRSKNMMKVKKFKDAEYKVLAVHNDILKWTENGKQIERECLSNIEIEHKGCIVSVGSGFSKEERMYYYDNPDELIGATVTIKYFQESQNENGGWSLRFPTVKAIYKGKRDI